MDSPDVANFCRVELLKERTNGTTAKQQAQLMGMEYTSLMNFMYGCVTRRELEKPIYKILNYLISKNLIVLCPAQKKQSSSGLSE